jgi:hypothetical protein
VAGARLEADDVVLVQPPDPLVDVGGGAAVLGCEDLEAAALRVELRPYAAAAVNRILTQRVWATSTTIGVPGTV